MSKISTKSLVFTPIFFVLVILAVTQNFHGQNVSQNGCVYVSKEKPSIFISYERKTTEQNEKGRKVQQVLLRLHNNSSCEITVETSNTYNDDSLYRKEVTTQENGAKIITSYIPDPPKRLELPVFYDIKESREKSWKPANYREDRDIVYTYPIPSGYSAVFSVDEKHFRKRSPISVLFQYSWEDNSELRTLGTIAHRVFYVYELPRGFYKDE